MTIYQKSTLVNKKEDNNMSSTNKFSSGLNNWLDSDSPERLDYVSDNQVLNDNAMWKAAYDADGSVATLGGIGAAIQAAVGASLTCVYVDSPANLPAVRDPHTVYFVKKV